MWTVRCTQCLQKVTCTTAEKTSCSLHSYVVQYAVLCQSCGLLTPLLKIISGSLAFRKALFIIFFFSGLTEVPMSFVVEGYCKLGLLGVDIFHISWDDAAVMIKLSIPVSSSLRSGNEDEKLWLFHLVS